MGGRLIDESNAGLRRWIKSELNFQLTAARNAFGGSAHENGFHDSPVKVKDDQLFMNGKVTGNGHHVDVKHIDVHLDFPETEEVPLAEFLSLADDLGSSTRNLE